MTDQRSGATRLAQLGYSEKYGRIELAVPYGLESAKLAEIGPKLFGDLVARLPRGCQACISGESLIIREQLENVLLIDLDTMSVVDR